MDAELSGPYISQYQFGFKKGNSTVHALLKFHNDIIQNLREKRCTVVVSLDVEKAFDKVYHNGILFKMIEIGFQPTTVKLFKSFFDERKFYAQIDNVLSSFCDVTCGVPQGSILAPHLYNISIYDFPHVFDGSKGLLYADDSLLYAHDESPSVALQHVSSHLNRVKFFYSQWGIKINATKSKAICIRNASGKCKYTVVPESKQLELHLDGDEIEFTDNLKYLGVNFNHLLKFNRHADYNLERANRIKGAFSNLFNNKFLSVRTKLFLYKVSIRPVLLYAFTIWFNISPTTMKKLEVFERNIIRKCLGRNFQSHTKRYSNEFIYYESKITRLSTYALDLMKRFVERLVDFNGSIFQEILNSEREFNWTNTNYLSALGIIQGGSNSSGQNFYSYSTPGTHRG